MIWRLGVLAIPAALLATAATADKPGGGQGPHISNGALEWVVFKLPLASVPGPGRTKDLTSTKPAGALRIKLSDCKLGQFNLAPSHPLRNYDCKARRLDNAALCPGSAVGTDPVDVTLMSGSFDDTAAYHTATNDEILLSCREGSNATDWKVMNWGSAAKCLDVWGYVPSKSQDLFEACVRMARADYAGDGASYTYAGTEVFVYDLTTLGPAGKPIFSYSCKHHCDKFWLEAAWDKDGAVCISHVRFDSLPEDPKDAWGARPKAKTRPGWKDSYRRRFDAALGIQLQACRATKRDINLMDPSLLYDRSEHHDRNKNPLPFSGEPRSAVDPQCACCDTNSCP